MKASNVLALAGFIGLSTVMSGCFVTVENTATPDYSADKIGYNWSEVLPTPAVGSCETFGTDFIFKSDAQAEHDAYRDSYENFVNNYKNTTNFVYVNKSEVFSASLAIKDYVKSYAYWIERDCLGYPMNLWLTQEDFRFLAEQERDVTISDLEFNGYTVVGYVEQILAYDVDPAFDLVAYDIYYINPSEGQSEPSLEVLNAASDVVLKQTSSYRTERLARLNTRISKLGAENVEGQLKKRAASFDKVLPSGYLAKIKTAKVKVSGLKNLIGKANVEKKKAMILRGEEIAKKYKESFSAISK